jgi:hypothetical protein
MLFDFYFNPSQAVFFGMDLTKAACSVESFADEQLAETIKTWLAHRQGLVGAGADSELEAISTVLESGQVENGQAGVP